MMSCASLRYGILLAGILLLAGFGAELLAVAGVLPVVGGSYLGLLLATSAVLLILGLFLVSMLPPVARRLAECER
jgi:hypothetical protein